MLLRREGRQFAALPGPGEGARAVSPAMIQAMQSALVSGTARTDYEGQAVCPKEVDVKFIARLNREFHKALFEAKAGALAPRSR